MAAPQAKLYLDGPTEGKRAWWDDPELLQGQVAHRLPLYHQASFIRSMEPSPADVKNLFKQQDAVIFSLDFETLCRQKVDANNVRYSPITEVCVSVLDLRHIREGTRRQDGTWAMPPSTSESAGDRGAEWRKRIKSSHAIVDEWHDQAGGNCRPKWHHTEPYSFGFGRSRFIRSDMIGKFIKVQWDTAKHAALNDAEKTRKVPRKIILITWASNLEETTLQRLGIANHIFGTAGMEAWDLQKFQGFRDHFRLQSGQLKGAAAACDSLGIITRMPEEDYDLSRCAGNDAAFTVQTLLAVGLLTPDQRARWHGGEELRPMLDPNFTGSTIYTVNKAPSDIPPKDG